MKKIMILAAAATLTACTSSQPEVLVLYYSQTGATKAAAEAIASELGADIESFDVEQPYDGDFNETIQRCIVERESETLSKVIPVGSDISKYDVIFLGYPVWFGVAARPVFSLLREVDLGGKTIVPFCTFGSGGLESSSENLKELLPDAEIKEGYGIRNARIAKVQGEIEKFLIAAGFKEGEIEALPEFSEARDLTEEDTTIFNAACGSYEMPLGEPVAVASRPLTDGIEYKFTMNTKGMNGEAITGTIYVTAPDGQQPEFTKVVR